MRRTKLPRHALAKVWGILDCGEEAGGLARAIAAKHGHPMNWITLVSELLPAGVRLELLGFSLHVWGSNCTQLGMVVMCVGPWMCNAS
jgi:hypothetical protein